MKALGSCLISDKWNLLPLFLFITVLIFHPITVTLFFPVKAWWDQFSTPPPLSTSQPLNIAQSVSIITATSAHYSWLWKLVANWSIAESKQIWWKGSEILLKNLLKCLKLDGFFWFEPAFDVSAWASFRYLTYLPLSNQSMLEPWIWC